MRNKIQNETPQERNFLDLKQIPPNLLQNLARNNPIARNQVQQSNIFQRREMPVMVTSMPPAQYYARPNNSSPPPQIMAQQRQVLPTLSKINFGIENPNMQPTMMAPQYGYGVRVPGGYMPVAMSNQQMNRMQPNNGQLPGINQFVNLLQNPQYGSRPGQHQIPSAYLQQAQLKNLMMNSQRRMEYQPYSGANRERQPPQTTNWNPNNPYGQRPT